MTWKEAEMDVMNSLFRDSGRSVRFHRNLNSEGGEEPQHIILNGKYFICPDLEIYENYNPKFQQITMRVEVKSMFDFDNENLPFKAKSDVLIISKTQFDKYILLQQEEEIPIYIVFAIGKGIAMYKYYWGSLENMAYNFPKKQGDYTWRKEKRTETCYFFRAIDFNRNIDEL
jgi:hypothetical protein